MLVDFMILSLCFAILLWKKLDLLINWKLGISQWSKNDLCHRELNHRNMHLFKLMHNCIFGLILLFVLVWSLQFLQIDKIHKPWTLVTAPKMSYDVTCVRLLSPNYSVIFATSVSLRHALGDISLRNQNYIIIVVPIKHRVNSYSF